MPLQSRNVNNYSNIIETIKCVNVACQKDGPAQAGIEAPEEIQHRLTYEECLNYIQNSEKQQYRDMYADVLFDILTPSSKVLVKCPKEGCDYTGFIVPRNKCNESLVCEKCYYSWTDPNLIPFCTKLRKCCCGWNMNFVIFNDLQKVLRAQGCPSCGISIIKGPGCKHMMCQQ